MQKTHTRNKFVTFLHFGGRQGVGDTLRAPTGLGKSGLNGEVTLLQGVICTVEYNLGLSHGDCNGAVFVRHGDCNGEVFVLVR